MNPNRALLGTGAFTRITDTRRQREENLVKSQGLAPGMIVLEFGWGDGTLVIPAARPGVDATGVNIASLLVAAGNSSVVKLGGPNCRLQAGDPQALAGWLTRSV